MKWVKPAASSLQGEKKGKKRLKESEEVKEDRGAQ